MSKAERDPRRRDAIDGGRGAASSSSAAEPPNVKPANATVQDDIPPVHVLEAAQNQDRKETEDLLAGFDRPGRGPKQAPKERDFVDYYARKKPGAGDSGGRGAGAGAAGSGAASNAGGAGHAPSRQRDVSTVIVHRDRKPMPVWLGWGAVAVGMLLVGGAVAYLATSDGHASAVEPTAPSAATTITSSTTPVQASPDTNVPPPDPAPTTTLAVTVVEPTASAPVSAATGARSASKRDGRAAPSASTAAPSTNAPATAAAAAGTSPRGTNATDDRKPPPRDDFIRDL